MALAMDTLGFYMSPSIFLTLFGNSVGAYLEIRALVIILYTMIFVWILLQMIAGMLTTNLQANFVRFIPFPSRINKTLQRLHDAGIVLDGVRRSVKRLTLISNLLQVLSPCSRSSGKSNNRLHSFPA